jgi:hypothetical protein
MLQAGRSRGSIPVETIEFINLPNPSSRSMTPGSTQHLTKMSARIPGPRIFLAGKRAAGA